MMVHDLLGGDAIVVHEREKVQNAAKVMWEKDIGMLPVVDARGRLTGVITDRDLAIRVVARGLNLARTTVHEVMTTAPLVTCRADDDVAIAETRMAAGKTSRIVVTDEHAHVLGILSLSDLATAGEPSAMRILREVAHRESPTRY